MPFQSQAQAGWAFATGQPWAKRWARETGPYKKLPKRVKRKALKDAPCMDCVLASIKASAEGPAGPAPKPAAGGAKPKPAAGGRGEQLAPGVTRIRGNLCNVHGRYGPCDGGSGGRKPKGRKPRKAAKPKQTPEQRAQARAAEQATNRTAVDKQLGLAEDTAGALDDLRAGKAVDDDGGLVKMGLAEQSADGSYRLTSAGRALVAARNAGDAGRARDIMSGAKDRTLARNARETAAEQRREAADKRKRDAAAKKPKGGGGGGKGKKPKEGGAGSRGGVSDEERAQQRQRREDERQADRRQRQQEHAQDRAQRQQEHAEDRARRQRERDEDRANRTPTPAPVPRSRSPIVTRGTPNTGTRRQPPRKRTPRAPIGDRRRSSKSFAVFKDSAGAYRWMARTTTAFEDRDSEVISTKALDDSAASSAPRGPLRWWHLGRPDPTSSAQPWGAGVDLGWCDFAAMSGKTLIESGTFKSEAIARAVAAKADQLELSPGFFHAAGEPDASGVFHHIRIFERSLVPKWAGRASNPYTGLVVEKTMDQKKIQALKELGASDEVITALLADVQQTEKSAEADGVRYKDTRPVVDFFSRLLRGEQITTKEEEAAAPVAEEPPPPAPDPLAELMATVKALQEEVASLKAPPAEMDAEDDPALGGDMGVDEAAEGEPPLEDAGGDEGGLTLSSEDLSAIGQVIGQVLSAALEPLVGALGITQKLDGHLSELKTMMGGFAKTKDDAHAAQGARIDQVEAKVAELSGDLPRAGYRASQAPENTVQALANAVALKDGSIPTDDNPFADLVQRLFPNQR